MTKQLTKEQLTLALESGFTQAQGVKGWNTKYVPKSVESFSDKNFNIKAIAFYLPQFHPIPENDEWWGKGFTEWTNVTKAVPQYLGHYQPHLPGELGFYDLRLADNIKEQAKLARHYGIHGFCLHHYWFDGKRLLEKPLELLLENKDIDINFCLSWANENWSRRWDGLENDILIAQNYSPEDDIAFIESLFEAFEDERYIRVDGKPMLIVYRTALLPDAEATALRWRKAAKAHGFKDLYIVAVKSLEAVDPHEIGFDAAVEFPPHQMFPREVTDEQIIINPEYSGKAYDYLDGINNLKKLKHEGHTTFRCVMPSWDNEARKPGKGFSFVNCTPEAYGNWLDFACSEADKNKPEEKFIFINAWNEWAEGTHLEPCREHGYRHLHVTLNSLRKFNDNSASEKIVESINSKFAKSSDVALVIHLYYADLADELIDRIKLNKTKVDVYLSLPKDADVSVLDKFLDAGLNIHVTLVENVGRDIKPFIDIYRNNILPNGYSHCGKVHTKKSLHRVDGEVWRNNLYNTLLDVDGLVEKFKSEPESVVAAPEDSLLDLSVPAYHKGNQKWLTEVLKEMQMHELIDGFKFDFIAGTMFWFKSESLKRVTELGSFDDKFEQELGQLDGTLAHTFERMFLLLATQGDLAKLIKLDTSSNIELNHVSPQ